MPASARGRWCEAAYTQAYPQYLVLTAVLTPTMLRLLVPVQTRLSVGLKRESGANPELPRSGKWKRNLSHALGRSAWEATGTR